MYFEGCEVDGVFYEIRDMVKSFVMKGDDTIVEKMMEKGYKIDDSDDGAENALNYACEAFSWMDARDHHERIVMLVKKLLDYGISPNGCGNSMLYDFVYETYNQQTDEYWKSHEKVLEMLVEYGADVNMCKHNPVLDYTEIYDVPSDPYSLRQGSEDSDDSFYNESILNKALENKGRHRRIGMTDEAILILIRSGAKLGTPVGISKFSPIVVEHLIESQDEKMLLKPKSKKQRVIVA